MSVRRRPFLPFVASIFALLSSACRPEIAAHSDAGPGAQPSAPAPAQRAIASLGERFLVHLVHPVLVRGTSASVLVHGTRLEDGAPLAAAQVELVFRRTGTGDVVVAAREKSPGTFPADVTLPEAGAWRVVARVRAGSGADDVELGEIVAHADARAAADAAAPEAPAGAIGFSFEQQWPLALRFERVQPRPFVERVAVTGRIEPRPGSNAHVTTLVAGRIAAPVGGELPRPGSRVARGEVLARVETFLGAQDLVGLQSLEYQQHQLRHELDLQQLEADRALSEARVRIQAGTRALERAERLLAETLATQSEVDEARAELDLARAAEGAALSSLASVHRLRNEHAEDPLFAAPVFELVAPIAGVLASSDLVAGESVEPGETLATILDLATVWAVAEVPEHELSRIDGLASARVRPRGLDLALDAAAPVHVAPLVDAATRFVDVAFEIGNADGRLRAGLLATIELAGSTRSDAISVPATAVAHEQGRPVVFVLHDGETFVKRRVKLGARDGERFLVVEGLAAGEAIAATRAEELRLASLAGSGQIVDHHHH